MHDHDATIRCPPDSPQYAPHVAVHDKEEEDDVQDAMYTTLPVMDPMAALPPLPQADESTHRLVPTDQTTEPAYHTVHGSTATATVTNRTRSTLHPLTTLTIAARTTCMRAHPLPDIPAL